jgi:hypothetical protein
MSFSAVNMKAVEAFHKVSLRIAQAGIPHTTGELLLLEAAKEIANSLLGEKVAKQLESIPLSNDTLSPRISDMASNVKEQLIEEFKASKYYSNQLGEGTDVSNIAHLLTFII